MQHRSIITCLTCAFDVLRDRVVSGFDALYLPLEAALSLHQQTVLDHYVYTHKPLKRCYSNCQSEML